MATPKPDSVHVRTDAIVVVPPPAEGQTLVTERICQTFAAELPFRLRAVRNTAGLAGPVWRVFKHLLILWHLLKGAVTSLRHRRAYFVPDSNLGLWLNMLQAPLLRLGYRDVWLHHHVFRYVRDYDWRMGVILKLLGPRVTHIVLGEAMADGLRAQYGAEQFHVLGNAAFVEDVPPAKRRSSLRRLGFLSNITEEKGIGLFMDTVRDAQLAHPSLACVIAGPIPSAALKARIEAFCAEDPDTRSWIGPVYGAQKAAFFEAIDLLLFPSQYANEALPVTIGEALAAGAPVLATDRGCIPDQLSGTGWVYAEDQFRACAADQIAVWSTDQLAFARASESASARYTAQRAADRAALARLIDRMGQP